MLDAPMNEPKTWKEVLLQSRIARYPLLSIVIMVGGLALLWWFSPDFVKFLRGAIPT
jgi:hypothetical protein